MTVPLVAAAFFGANIDHTRRFLHEYGCTPAMTSKSHLNRRIHAIEPSPWWALFSLLAEAFKKPSNNPEQTYVVDSLPIPVYDNIRIRRCRLYPPEEHGGASGGYIRYISVSSATSTACGCIWWSRGRAGGVPLIAGSEADLSVFKDYLELDLPEGSIILADKAYTDCDYEDLLEEVGLHLKAQRKKNSKRPPMSAWEEFLGKPIHQYIETVFSRLSALFAGKIHAVAPKGFELKIVWFLLAFSIQCL